MTAVDRDRLPGAQRGPTPGGRAAAIERLPLDAWTRRDRHHLAIEMQLDRKGSRVALKTKRSKRSVAITPDLATALAELRLAAGRPGDHELVFTRPDGRPHSHASAALALARAVKAAGIVPAPTFHDLRHSHVSRLFAAGKDPVYIAARAGDAVATVLRVYAHEYDDARRRASESDEPAALYDRGSAVKAPDGNAAQQTATGPGANVASLSAKRSPAQ
jgi:integrase